MPIVKDKKIANKIDELAELNNEISLLKEKLKEQASKAKGIEAALRPILEGLSETEQRILITDKNVVEIQRRGYERRSLKYKAAFELALSKVNKSVKRILNDSLDASVTISNVASSISSRPRTDESLQLEFLGKLASKLKSLASKFSNKIKMYFKGIDSANNVLGKLAKTPEDKLMKENKMENSQNKIRRIIREELKKVKLNEFKVNSNIDQKWEIYSDITDDIFNYIMMAQEASNDGGQIILAIEKGIKKSKRQM